MSPEQLTLTWLNMPEKDADQKQYTFQLRLYAGGDFEMTFVDLSASRLYNINRRWQTARVLGALPGYRCDALLKCVATFRGAFIAR